MANRSEIRADLDKLVADKTKLDDYVSGLDKQAEVAKKLNLTSKENEVTNVQSDIAKELFELITPLLDEVKSLRAEVAELKSGAVAKEGEDTPAKTLSDMIKEYVGTKASDTPKPDPNKFTTPVTSKAANVTDLFEDIGSGVFDKPAAKK